MGVIGSAPPGGELMLYRSTKALLGNIVAGAAGIAALAYYFVPGSGVEILVAVLIALAAAFTLWHVILLVQRRPQLILRLDGLVEPGGRVVPWIDVTGLDVETRKEGRSPPSKWLRLHLRDPRNYWQAWQPGNPDYIATKISGLSRNPDEILSAAQRYWQANTGRRV